MKLKQFYEKLKEIKQTTMNFNILDREYEKIIETILKFVEVNLTSLTLH